MVPYYCRHISHHCLDLLIDQSTLFLDDTAEPSKLLRDLAALIASVSKLVGNQIAVEGHIRAAPVVRLDHPVWDMSIKRADAMRHLLEVERIEPKRVRRITGHADREPVHENPMARRNDRIEIVLLRK